MTMTTAPGRPPPIEVLDVTGARARFIDRYRSAEWTQRVYRHGDFKVEVTSPPVDLVAMGSLLRFDDESVYLVEQVERVRTGTLELWTVEGREYGRFTDRVVIPPATQDYHAVAGAAETVMHTFVNAHAGPGAPVVRQVPNLVMGADLGRGGIIPTVKARYQTLADVLEFVGVSYGVGWQVVHNPSSGEFEFHGVVGDDLTAQVFMDTRFDTLRQVRLLTSELGQPTVAIVGGQGDLAARQVETTWVASSEPSGLDRREVFLDATDLDAAAALVARGDARLRENVPAVFEVTVAPYGSFRYGEHFTLGDYVTVREARWGISQPAQVVEVRQTVSRRRGREIVLTLDRPFPDVRDDLRIATGRGSTAGGTQFQ